MRECHCDEVKLDGPLRPKLGWNRVHDCDYVARRNMLIPEAERIADAQTAALVGSPIGLQRQREWARAFLAAMHDLSRKLYAC